MKEQQNLQHNFINNNERFMKDFLTNHTNEEFGIWVFGYGSLVWKANFKYQEKHIGHIKGYKRRFWQASSDHRGTLELPGRVATLIPSLNKQDIVFGMGYYIPPNYLKESMDILNFREKQGFSLTLTEFFPEHDHMSTEKALLYIAEDSNSNFIKDTNLLNISARIKSSCGKSGENKEYLFNLAEFLINNKLITDDDRDHTLKLYELVQQQCLQ